MNTWIAWGGDPTLWGIVLQELGVDGGDWNCPHAAIAEDAAGTAKCVFHLSPEEVPEGENASQALQDVLVASEGASNAWAKRLKQFIGAKFGALKLDNTQLTAANDQPLYLIGTTVTSDLTISGPHRHRIVATLATFEGRADFSNATFNKEADFQKTTFKREADFSEATFKREADFREATFVDVSSFTDVTFERRVNFRMATFMNEVNFENTTFARRLIFDDALFNREPNFDHTSFQDGCECGRERTSGSCL